MKRLLCLLVFGSLLLTGCGTIIVRGALNDTTSVSGTVSIVNLSVASDGNGASITVTVVTLLQTGTAQTLTFCGSQVSQFPMDTFVTARFTPGTTCSTIVSVSAAH